MKKPNLLQLYSVLAAVLTALATPLQAQLSDVTQPGDPIIASSPNSPEFEQVANAIDNQPTKYLNFDSGNTNTFIPSGFIVTPSIGATHVRGIALQSANDAPNRDPKAFTLEGSNDDTIATFNSGTWEMIATVTNITPWTTIFGTGTPDPSRLKWQTFYFHSPKPYKHYRWIVTETQTTPNGCCMQIAEVEFLGGLPPPDVTQPGDPIIASSPNSPEFEQVANAIDNQPTKYLNFDSGNTNTFIPSGFVVSPSIGRTLVTGISLQSANDAPNRDPKAFTLEGSNDTNITSFASGNWEVIATITNITPWTTLFGTGTPDPSRLKTQTFMFPNPKPYRHYRWIVTETQTTPNGCCMQIAEVELRGSAAPRDVTQPGDALIASSPNSPEFEQVANAIDDQPTKYLNFDSGNTNTFIPSGFIVTPRVGASTVIGLTMQSANDAPNRDPKAVTLEGSNDDTISSFNSGNWELITAITNITPWTTIFGTGTPDPSRLKTQEFFFDNPKPYKHYRWIVTETQTTPNGCCMQIAEVEFLAVPRGGGNTNEITTLIRRQPQDTPVLLGARPTFRVFTTGPWLVQWYSNNVAIPGATAQTYTGVPAAADQDGDIYHAVVQSPDGQQTSDPAMLNIFTPSTTESFGLSWIGDGANGAPTEMLPEDITGFHLQAYWNNLDAASGTLTTVTNSNNEVHSTVNVNWATSGEWGSGTGEADPTERMLNGMTKFPDNGGSPLQTVTFSGVPAGSHSLLLYTVQVPREFFNMDFTVVTFNADGTEKATQQRFIRPQNTDEYNPSPGWVLVTSLSAATRGVGNMTRYDNLQTDNGTIEIRFMSPGRVQPPGAQSTRGPGLNGLQLLLNAGTIPEAPVITQDPVGENAPAGGTVVLRVQATGNNLSYQWLKNGQPIAGETGTTLTLDNLQQSDAGRYSVAVSNPAGRVVSRVAVVDVLETDSVTEDLVAYFKFDEPGFDLGVADNSAPGGVDGEVRGTAFDATFGRVNNAILLNGTDNYVFVPDYVKPTNAMTVMGWVQAADQTGTIINNWVADRSIGSRGQFLLDLEVPGGTLQLRGLIASEASQPTVSAAVGSIATNWNHFALSANGSTLSLYSDGQLVGSLDYVGDLNIVSAFPWLSIGANFNGDTNAPAAGNFLSGALDELAIWKRGLSGAEINAIYTAGLAGQAIDQVPPVSAPFLTVFRQGSDVVVSWSQNVLGYTLESSPSLTPANWTTVTGVANNRYTATGAAGATGMRFFRLIKQ